MKTFISFFIFLISFFAPAQAINFTTPAQVGSYSNPIEPIKPKAKTYKFWKNPIQNKTQYGDTPLIISFCILGLVFIGGLILFSIGLLQGIALFLWLGLAAEMVWVLGLFLLILAWGYGDDVSDIPFGAAILGFIYSLVIKGALLIVLGIIASTPGTWITGIALLAIGLVLLIWLWATN